MVNLLWIAEDTSKLPHRNFHYLERELQKHVKLMIWRKSGHISYILKQLPRKPDFILLLNDIDRTFSPMIKGLATVSIPTGLFINDVHRFTNLRRNYIAKHKIDYLFPVVRDKFIETYPEFKHKMKWFPHFVNVELCKDYGLDKDIPLLLLGAVSKVYPLRQKIIQAYEGDPAFVYYQHPGYRSFKKDEEQSHLIGEMFAREINRAKILFTSPSVYRYPVLKYFEALACKTLLLAPTFRELEDLGFVPGRHFVAINKTNFKDKAAYFLENEQERQSIVGQGYDFVTQNHTVEIRVSELVNKIKEIIHK